ncbi:MAG: DNA sulfur modification protein DndB [bacterium]|nr:DNA sulfur modification protein DndB [bacterium]
MKTKNLLLPALRGKMGDWIYYVTLVKLSDMAERITFAHEIHKSNSLNELIQRVLQKEHTQNIAKYLLEHEQRFFNSLVIGVYGGMPEWYELDIKENEFLDLEENEFYVEETLGLLKLSGNEILFAIDGQHRVAGIKQAVEQSKSLGNEEVSAIFVAHKNNSEGMERTRRLFTSLNRHAKPVGFGELVALDEDDVVAIVTRMLIENHPLFDGKISISTQKNIPRSDKTSLTSVVALYEVVDIISQDIKPKAWFNFKKSRPEDDIIQSFYERSKSFFDSLIEHFAELKDLLDSKLNDNVSAKYRNESGGHLLFRPIGLVMISKVVKDLMQHHHKTLDEAVTLVSKIDLRLSEKPWVGLLWDAKNANMIVNQGRQPVARYLLFYMCGGDLTKISKTLAKVKKQMAGIVNREIDELEIPDPLSID